MVVMRIATTQAVGQCETVEDPASNGCILCAFCRKPVKQVGTQRDTVPRHGYTDTKQRVPGPGTGLMFSLKAIPFFCFFP